MRFSLRPRHGAALFAVALSPAAATAQDSTARRAFTPADVYRVVTVAAPTLSPDGRQVAFTVTTVDERANRRHTEVWTAPTAAGGAPARLSWPDSESTAPRFLPDGRLLFSSGARGGRARTYAVRPGPGASPALAIGAPPAGASWSRDGRVVVWADSVVASSDSARGEFTRSDSAMRDVARRDTSSGDTTRRVSGPGGAAPSRALSRPPFGAVTRPLDSARFDGRHVIDFPYKSNDRGYLANRASARRWNPTQLYAGARGDSTRRPLTATAYSHSDAALSPDGRTVAFVADSALRPDSVVQAERDSLARLPYDRKRDNAERNEVDVYVRPVEGGGEVRKLATLGGVESQLEWAPDGRSIAFVWRPARARSATLATVDVATGRVRNLLGDVPWEPASFTWVNERSAA
jgi:dipeptidyl aminopeptidase/acylaminoacyl peptidase